MFCFRVLDYFSTKDPMYHIFSESLGKMEFNEGDSKHQDSHQEDQDDKECPPSI